MSILFKEDGLVFCIYRQDLGKYIVLGEYEITGAPDGITSLFDFYTQFPNGFSNVQVGYFSPRFTLVPATLFNRNHAQEYITGQFTLGADETLGIDELPTHSMVLLYALPNGIAEATNRALHGHVLHHSAYYTISHYLAMHKNKPGEHIHANIWRGTVELVVVRNGRLVLCTAFAYQTPEDLLYYILNAYEQLELSPEVVPLKLSGEVAKGTYEWQLVEKYIRFVELESRPQGQYSHAFKTFAEHQYNRIYQAAQCA